MKAALFALRLNELLDGVFILRRLLLMSLGVDSQCRVDALLKLCPLRLKPLQHIIVNTQGNGGFTLRHPPLRPSKKLIL